jgi:hypothetical protein
LFQWNGQALERVTFNVDGQVLSIAVGPDNGWRAIVRRADSLVVIDASNAATAVAGTLLLSGGRILGYWDGALHLNELSFPLINAPLIMEWVNSEWINLGGSALRITPGKEGLFLLPETK